MKNHAMLSVFIRKSENGCLVLLYDDRTTRRVCLRKMLYLSAMISPVGPLTKDGAKQKCFVLTLEENSMDFALLVVVLIFFENSAPKCYI